MQLPESAGPSELCVDVDDAQQLGEGGPSEAIFTCKFPGCTRQYASTDGASPAYTPLHCGARAPGGLRRRSGEPLAHARPLVGRARGRRAAATLLAVMT